MGSIRSEYIKNLMAEKNALNDMLAEATKESLRSILSESVNKGIRQILSEADDKFEEEEITDDATDGAEEMTDTEVKVDTEEPAKEETEPEEDGEEEAGEETVDITATEDVEDANAVEGEDDVDKEVWDRLDSYIDNDGEYDLTGMSDEDMIKVMKVVDYDKDGVRVVKNDNTLTLTDDNAGTEYIIDLGDACEEEDTIGESKVNEVDLGYTDDYQKETAMTMPSDDNAGGQFDAGAPKGSENNGKRWPGNAGDMAPYNEEEEIDDEEMVFEVETDECGMNEDEGLEEMTTMANGSRTLGTKGDTNHSEEDRQRHIHKSYDRIGESMKKKLNAIIAENKQLKEIAGQFRSKLDEAVVMNASLAKIIKLVTENSTTRDEKIDIVKRFNNVTTINECKNLYETIDSELKKSHPINGGVEQLIASPVNESKPSSEKEMIVETTLLNSKELKDTIDLMKRMEKC